MLGFRTLSVFSEFLLKLQSTDPRELIRLSNIRAEAIATCVSRVLEEGETLFSGWTLFSPVVLNIKLGEKFEEKVLLLVRQFRLTFGLSWFTETFAPVSCRLIYHSKGRTSLNSILSLKISQSFDYNLAKVKVSTRVPLQDIVSITKGTPNLSWVVSPIHPVT
jgi:phosphatidylinositol 4-phosphatase